MQDLVNAKHLEALYLLMLRSGRQKSVCAPLHCLAANLNSTQLVYLFEPCLVTMLTLKHRILGSVVLAAGVFHCMDWCFVGVILKSQFAWQVISFQNIFTCSNFLQNFRTSKLSCQHLTFTHFLCTYFHTHCVHITSCNVNNKKWYSL